MNKIAALETYIAWLCECDNQGAAELFYSVNMRALSSLRTILLHDPHTCAVRQRLYTVFKKFRKYEHQYIGDLGDLEGFNAARAELQAEYEALEPPTYILPRRRGCAWEGSSGDAHCLECRPGVSEYIEIRAGLVYACQNCHEMFVSE